MSTQVQFDQVSSMSENSNTPTPVKNMFSPRPDGSKRQVNEHSNVTIKPEEVCYEEKKHSVPILTADQAAIIIQRAWRKHDGVPGIQCQGATIEKSPQVNPEALRTFQSPS